MESTRLLIRRMEKVDEASFVSGIADRALRIAYGFPADMDDAVSAKIFERFFCLNNSYSLVEKDSGAVIGFLLEERENPGLCGFPALPAEGIYAGSPAGGDSGTVPVCGSGIHTLRTL